MRKITLYLYSCLLIVALILAGCQAPVMEEEKQTEVVIEEENIVEISNEPLGPATKEEPIIEKEETPLEVENTSTEEAIEETPQILVSEGEPLTVRLKEGESIEFAGKTITIDNIDSGTDIEFNVAGAKSRLIETRTSEIVNSLRVTYERAYFNVDSEIEITVEEFKLGPNEYLLGRKEWVKVKDHRVRLDNIKVDSTIWKGVAWLSLVDESSTATRLPPGETKSMGNVSVTTIETFWRAGSQYAHFKIE